MIMAQIIEKLSGVVQRVTYHNPVNGWSVLKVQSYGQSELVAVTVHQTKVFAGATMEFHGNWVHHSQFGRQFKADKAVEKKPATAGALEKYLGSGLIKGVGPKTARRIVSHFGADTLHVFEGDIERLTEVPGIAKKKLTMIEEAWREHRMIRDVMIFLQGHGVSTLFAVRIYKKYGEQAVEIVSRDPYRLAYDFYGIGFFSADRIGLSIGFAPDSDERVTAAIRHVLAAARDHGHCYLTCHQICEEVEKLLNLQLEERVNTLLGTMEQENQLKVRFLVSKDISEPCYYSKSLYFDEQTVVEKIAEKAGKAGDFRKRLIPLIERFCRSKEITLSDEQFLSVTEIVEQNFSILTGGPGCGKTTTTLVIVRVLEALGLRIQLGAPTGRAAQRMGEVIGREAKTLHRLLEWQQGGFLRSEDFPLECDFLIVDECSMLDISLTASLLRALPKDARLLFIGDGDQLPSVGAGNVLGDIIQSGMVPSYQLTKVFRQAQTSKIIQYAHSINSGETPHIESPFKHPELWQKPWDCLFIDSDESTKEQVHFIQRAKRHLGLNLNGLEMLSENETPHLFRTSEPIGSPYEKDFEVPQKFKHVDLEKLVRAGSATEELKAVLKKVHPWSTLHYGLSAVDTVVKLYLEWIPRYYTGEEIQILSPMTRGSLGTVNLNKTIQEVANPQSENKPEIQVGERLFRQGDRVIHRKNNYDLHVFNGDIGKIISIDTESLMMIVSFFPDGRTVEYKKDDIVELDLAYAITIHKSQGSEFSTVIIPVLTQHFTMLYRNLLYTGITRARKLAVLVGTRRALGMAVRQVDTTNRQTGLKDLLQQSMESGGR